ncbi:hypothetical protein IAR50_001461 [Cryptococcus sp. DSM 104548]
MAGAFSLPSISPVQPRLQQNAPLHPSHPAESPRRASSISAAHHARQERRASMPSSPYVVQSPRQRQGLVPGAGSWTGSLDSVETMSLGSASGSGDDVSSSGGSSR